jgi:Fe(II)/alpha-ketoglutarate-dependent arginine beta-hydroxylase
MNKITLLHEEIAAIKSIVGNIASQYRSAEDSKFLMDACLYAHELPMRVRKFINDFKMSELKPGFCIISGYPIDDATIGKTPSHWKYRPAVSPTLEVDLLLVILGTLLGDAMGWATQQDGHIIHDIFPIKECENEQLGTGSAQTLWWHNEDAFHEYRGDYIGMACLRNSDDVATTVASIDNAQVDGETIKLLFEPHFAIRPDESHQEKNAADLHNFPLDPDDPRQMAYKRIQEMNDHVKKVAIMYGHPQSPYIRVDPYFMLRVEDNERAQLAVENLIKALDSVLMDVVMRSGDIIFIDNYKAVHGRKPFKPRYDGTDRWLKRINITRDLRKSRGARISYISRVIY